MCLSKLMGRSKIQALIMGVNIKKILDNCEELASK